jgi:hypothetical protein
LNKAKIKKISWFSWWRQTIDDEDQNEESNLFVCQCHFWLRYSKILKDSAIYEKREHLLMIKMTSAAYGELIYQAYEFNNRRFFEYVDKKTNILIIIRTINDYVFGAYTAKGWGDQPINDYIYDEDAFIFSIRREGKTECHCFRFKNPAQVLYGDRNGITFGDSEIIIRNETNVAILGESFDKPQGYTLEEKKSFLTGTSLPNSWSMTHIEVYKIDVGTYSYNLDFIQEGFAADNEIDQARDTRNNERIRKEKREDEIEENLRKEAEHRIFQENYRELMHNKKEALQQKESKV